MLFCIIGGADLMNNYSNKLDIANESKLKLFFEQDGAEILPQQNAFWRARSKSYSAIFYNTGKFLVQGSDISPILSRLETFFADINVSNQNSVLGSSCVSDSIVPFPHIGVDESGKGDFFGPLVIAGVLVSESVIPILEKAGVKDCKKVDDKNINKLTAVIKNNCPFSVITINPTKYNELYSKLNNLNQLLAWGHARAIENILEKEDCKYALSDKFGDEKLIQNAMLQKGRTINLSQRCKAESDIAVAAASIVARAHFLKGISEISVKYGVDIPKGASDRVIEAAKLIKNKYSKEELKNAAKIHFKTYSQL